MPTRIYRQRIQTTPRGKEKVSEERVFTEESHGARYPAGRYTGYRILYFLLDILETLLALRLLMLLLAADPLNVFASYLYRLTDPLVTPFRSALSPTVTQGTVIEWSTVLAMVVYALAVYALVRLIDMLTD